jgi:hypothetical protein
MLARQSATRKGGLAEGVSGFSGTLVVLGLAPLPALLPKLYPAVAFLLVKVTAPKGKGVTPIRICF